MTFWMEFVERHCERETGSCKRVRLTGVFIRQDSNLSSIAASSPSYWPLHKGAPLDTPQLAGGEESGDSP